MLNLDFETTQDIVILFVVAVLLGAIGITYWADRAERKAERKRKKKQMPEPEEQEETRRAA